MVDLSCVCAYCKVHLRGPSPDTPGARISHGMCEACYEAMEAEMDDLDELEIQGTAEATESA